MGTGATGVEGVCKVVLVVQNAHLAGPGARAVRGPAWCGGLDPVQVRGQQIGVAVAVAAK